VALLVEQAPSPQQPAWRNPNPSATGGCLVCLPRLGYSLNQQQCPAEKERCVWQCDPLKFAHLLAGVSANPWPVLVGLGEISRCTVCVEMCLCWDSWNPAFCGSMTP